MQHMYTYLSKIGEYSVRVCSGRPDGVLQVATAYAYDLG